MRLHKTIVLNYLSYGLSVITNIILFSFLIRKIGIYEAGFFSFLYSLKSILDIGMGWLSGSVIKKLIDDPASSKETNFSSLLLNAGYGFCCVIGIDIYSFFANSVASHKIVILLFSFYVLFSFLFIPFREYLLSKFRQDVVVSIELLQNSMFFLFIMLDIFIFHSSSLISVFFLLAVSYFFRLIVVIFVGLRAGFMTSFSHYSLSNLRFVFMKSGWKYFINGVSTILFFQIDVILIAKFYGMKNVALYTIIWKIPNTVMILFSQYIDPHKLFFKKMLLAERHTVWLERILMLTGISFVSGMLFLVLYSFMGSYILSLWLGGKVVPSLPGMYIMPSIAMIMLLFIRIYSSFVYYADGLLSIALVMFVLLITKVGFIILLFDKFGVLSSVYAIVFSGFPALFFALSQVRIKYNNCMVSSMALN